MSNAKPFKTIDELIGILKRRNVLIPDEGRAKLYLERESYYALINGYKDPFIDKDKSKMLKEDYYKDGTTFEDFVLLFEADKALRCRTRDILMVAEAILKSATVYAFCYYHRESEAYLDPSSYIPKKDYFNEKLYTKNLIRLLNILQNTRDNKQHKQYIEHYKTDHGFVPLWVISKALTFGNMSSFFGLQKTLVQNSVCINIQNATNKPKRSIGIDDVREAYGTLSSFRNICAHKERLYCAREGKRDKSFKDMLDSLSKVLDDTSWNEYIAQIIRLVTRVKKQDSAGNVYRAFEHGMQITIYDLMSMHREAPALVITGYSMKWNARV